MLKLLFIEVCHWCSYRQQHVHDLISIMNLLNARMIRKQTVLFILLLSSSIIHTSLIFICGVTDHICFQYCHIVVFSDWTLHLREKKTFTTSISFENECFIMSLFFRSIHYQWRKLFLSKPLILLIWYTLLSYFHKAT